MQKIVLSLIVFTIIGTGLLSGCTNNQTGIITTTNPPVNINQFTSTKEGDVLRFYFLLEDRSGINTYSNGHAKMIIFDNANNTLYTQEFTVKTTEFVDYQFKLTGQGIGKAYEWRVPLKDIQKGMSSYGFGKSFLTFTTPDNTILTAEDTLVQIPTYTQEEIASMQETEYQQSAVNVNKVVTKGNFKVTVTKAGFYNTVEWDQKKHYLRVDMEVTNIGSQSEYFSPSGTSIIDSQSNQHDYSYGGTLDLFSSVYPSIIKKGSVLFEGISTSESVVTLVFELGYDENFNQYQYSYVIDLK